MKTHLELRKAFKDFWESKEHKEVPPIPLVPKDDPTTLFTGSGMQQLVPYLLGEPHPLGKKLFNIQPCFRAQDIEEVGDNRHTTFFEMMGNWSLGTYFKQEQLPWMWEFFTEVVGLPKDKLHVSVFEGYKNLPADDESFEVWKKLGVPEDRIHKYGPDKNWWSRAGVPDNMPPGEPGGPDSEVFYEFSEIKHDKKFGEECHPNCDCGRFLEIGNSVFMQYKKEKDGSFSELPNKNVDYGGGLERLAAAANDNPDIFEIGIFRPLYEFFLSKIQSSGREEELKKDLRIVLDHARAAIILISDGVLPGNKERNYIVRKLIRRAHDHMGPLLVGNEWKRIVEHFRRAYDGVLNIKSQTLDYILEEIQIYNSVLKNVPKLQQKILDLKQKYPSVSGASLAAGPIVWEEKSARGVPLEISKSIIEASGLTWDLTNAEVIKASEVHKEVSRKSAQGKFKGGLADEGAQTVKYHTATHLIHQALFDVMGDVRQDGSNITSERLRFDFFSEKRPSQEDIKKVEEIVNEKVKEALPVHFEMMPKSEAEKIGARAFFKEKYADTVKIYFVGDYSKEFCGGPHVQNSKEVGKVSIYKFEKIGSNLYRLYAK